MTKIFDRVPVRFRITFGLVGLMTGAILLASAVGFFPNEQREVMRGRARLCESLAISGTAMASSGDLDDLQVTLQSVVNRDEHIVSMGLRNADGVLLVAAGPHEEAWDPACHDASTQMRVPIFRKGDRFGELEVGFISTGGTLGLNYWAPAWLLVFLIPACLIQYSFFLKKTLESLDPNGAVPQHVRGALDTLTVGLLLMDTRDRILFANRLLVEGIKLDPVKSIGQKASSLAWVSDDDETELPWQLSLRTGQMVSGRILKFNVGDRQLTYNVNCTPILGQGLMVTFEDITQLEENKVELAKAKNAAEQANQSKSAFLANMSHEIRTPMNAILGFTEVLRRDIERDEGKRRRHLNTIHSSGTHLLNLINDILDLSKIEADKLEVEKIECAVHRVIADVVTVMRVRAEEKEISLDYQFQGPIPERINSDPARLRQILTNLVGNAIKFTERGGVRIVCQLAETDHDQKLVIQVVDTGIGMTQEAADKIFDPFSQADASVTRRFGGTGLGLSISKRLAEALGGGIKVTSEVGVGSVFTVVIDTGSIENVEMIQPSIEELEAEFEEEEHLAIYLPDMRVLLVDDGEENRDLMSVILDEAGTNFATAENGLQAVEMATKEPWDVILMDMQMPVMDGYTATRTLRQQGYDKPIIALTAHAMQHAEQECLDAGCTGFLTKPIDIDQLIVKLAEIAGIEVKSVTSSCSQENDALTVPETGNGTLVSDPIRSTLPMHKERFRQIVEQFVERLDERFGAIQEAYDSGNVDALVELGHWLKGASGNCGFAEVAEAAERLEHCGREGDIASIESVLQELRELHARIEVPSSAQIVAG